MVCGYADPYTAQFPYVGRDLRLRAAGQWLVKTAGPWVGGRSCAMWPPSVASAARAIGRGIVATVRWKVQTYVKSPIWWIKNDRIGRSRLFVLVFAVLCSLSSAVIGWPGWSAALMALILAVVLFVGDYLF